LLLFISGIVLLIDVILSKEEALNMTVQKWRLFVLCKACAREMKNIHILELPQTWGNFWHVLCQGRLSKTRDCTNPPVVTAHGLFYISEVQPVDMCN